MTDSMNRRDSLTVREWLRLYTDREPPPHITDRLLDSPVNRVPRALFRPAAKWMRSIGVDG